MAEPIRFEDTATFLLAKVSTAFRSALERQLATIGLHGGQIFALIELWERDGLRQIDLARKLDVSAPTVNKTIKGLVEIGLVTSSRIDDDARSTRIYLTDLGHATRERIEEQWHDLEADCLSVLNKAERAVFFDVLHKLRNNYTGRPNVEDED